MSAIVMPFFQRRKAELAWLLLCFFIVPVFADPTMSAVDTPATMATSTVELGRVTVDGRISDNLVNKTIRRNAHLINACAEEGVPSEGTAIIEYDVQSDGTVMNCRVKSSTIQDTTATTCIKHVLKGIQHPAPQDGQVATVSLPMRFILTLKF